MVSFAILFEMYSMLFSKQTANFATNARISSPKWNKNQILVLAFRANGNTEWCNYKADLTILFIVLNC